MSALWVRGVLYVLLAAVLAQLILLEAESVTGPDQFSEFGMVEFAQSLLLAGVVAVLFLAGRQRPSALVDCMALGFAILLVRENDQILELWFPHGVWKWPALVLFLWLTVLFIKHRRALFEELRKLSDSTAFGVLLAGFATLVFARLFGRGDLWESVMEERYWRPVKNAAEEGVELFALGLLVAGALELVWAGRRRGG